MTISEINAEQDWVRLQYLKATQHLADIGIVTDSVALNESRYLNDVAAIWKLISLEGLAYWVVVCHATVDALPAHVAADARAVANNMAMRWQLKAAELRHVNDAAKAQQAVAYEQAAELLYQLSADTRLWGDGA